MGEASVSAKVGRSGSPPLLLLLLCASSSHSTSGAAAGAGGREGEAGMVRRRVGAGLLVWALRSSSRVVMRSPEAENRREKTTPESRSTKDTFGSAAVGAAVAAAVAVKERRWEGQGSGVCCSPRVRRGREAREDSDIQESLEWTLGSDPAWLVDMC
ncbi:hypothetical protein BJV78DRAFT_1195088 [Lactifluus subvellereus]|nr:hypothetical protein BJV78DRAFT_1195088 [Lactifluus subvellereus]